MLCDLCNDQPAHVSARLLSDDLKSIDWRNVCEPCLDNEGFCESGGHYANRKFGGGLLMLHDPNRTWTSCGGVDCDRLAARHVAEFAIRDGLPAELARSQIEQMYGPNGTMPFPQAARLMEDRLRELEAAAEAAQPESFSMREPEPFGPWDRRVTAVRPLAGQERNDYWEQLLFQALRSHGTDRVRMALTRAPVLEAELRAAPSVSHQRRVDTLKEVAVKAREENWLR